MKVSAVLVAALALALGGAACSQTEPSTPAGTAPVAVTTVTAAMQDLWEPIEAGGVVRARNVATLASRIMAEVQGVAVQPGDRVRAGQALITLDARELQANRLRSEAGESAARHGLELAEADRQAAEAALSLAKVTHQRFTELRGRNSATQHELDEAVAGLRSAESRLAVADARISEARAALEASAASTRAAVVATSYATLAAPFDGVVTEKLIEPGNMAAPGQPLMTVEDTRGFRLEVRLDESRAAFVGIGDAVSVTLDAAAALVEHRPGGDPAVTGRIAEISRVLAPGSYDFLVKIDLPPAAPGLRSGMYGRVALRGRVHRGLAVPPSALVRRGQLAFVYVVEADNRAHLRMVNTGEPAPGGVEIRAGLLEGERVITSPAASLTDGSIVRPSAAAGTAWPVPAAPARGAVEPRR